MASSIRAFELRKYFNPQTLPPIEDVGNAKPPSIPPPTTPCRDALAAFTQVVCARLGVLGAFVTLTDGTAQHFMAGSTDDAHGSLDGVLNVPATAWFREADDGQGWLVLTQRILDRPAAQRCLCIPDLTTDEDTKALSSVTGSPCLRFYAAAPIVTKLDICIGVLFVVHDSARLDFPEREMTFLQGMAKQCMGQLEMMREVEAQRRGLMMSEGIDTFIQHREGVKTSPGQAEAGTKFTPGASPQSMSFGGSTNVPKDSLQAHDGSKENSEQLSQSAQQANRDAGSDDVRGETTYRKTFRRAAACLRTSLEVEGVLFLDGFVGFHGGVMAAGEPEQELQCEMDQITKEKQTEGNTTGDETPHEDTRVFISADYRKDINTSSRAEILGYSVQHEQLMPPTEWLSERTKGLAHMDEGFLQLFLERYPEGRTWYFDEAGNPFRFDGDALVPAADGFGDADRIALSLPKARHVLFSPLTDPAPLKHLAGCFAWTSQVQPVFTDGTVLCPFKAFLHTVVAEISRLDTVAAVEQQASFVSSVSHELRSPLHGILGAAELLADTDLDDFQKGLADTVRACGSTLQDTLSNVLSYAKINDFEQKRNTHEQQRPKDSPWALENKAQQAVRQGGPTSGLYVSTDIALLCEDIVQVLESGRLYNASSSDTDTAPTLTLDISYHESWIYMTEPGALRRIMMNIIGNAMKYSPKGEVVISLDACDVGIIEPQDEPHERWKESDGTEKKVVVFTVKDTGKGMSRHFLENQLFLPFHQEDSVKSEGVGLGMSIVKSLANLLGGKVEVTSQLGKGSEFKVILPMTAGKITQHVPGAPATEQDLAVLRSRNLAVALHGLDHTTAKSLRACLVNWCNCAVVALGDNETPSDVILADGTDSNELQELQSQLNAYNERSAVLTISAGPPQRASSIWLGERHVWERVSRPLGPHRLAKALMRCLERLQHPEQSQMKTNIEGPQEALPNKRPGPRVTSDTTHSAPALSLPRMDSSRSRSGTGKTSPSASDVSRSATPVVTNTATILIVEDNKINLKLLETFFAKRGYPNVESAADGLQAVQAAERRAEGFDIIITDISMPVMDGFEASSKIRELERLASANHRDKALRSGVDVFVTKPVRLGELGELLARWERGEISGGSAEETVSGTMDL
ncbi:hypothetical protein LTR36_006173 [Oleoguttula mirabilis]|uniref:histidine kinase n=1 Tax=Oleoguttula mirabilis TaxID=1507867 RepID=A0AAV9JCC1_9PEZI|nr:hypothetical protein LTR36_006173 [Oleoguttula mirabilis]